MALATFKNLRILVAKVPSKPYLVFERVSKATATGLFVSAQAVA